MLKKTLAICTLTLCAFLNLQAETYFSDSVEISLEDQQEAFAACHKCKRNHKKHKKHMVVVYDENDQQEVLVCDENSCEKAEQEEAIVCDENSCEKVENEEVIICDENSCEKVEKEEVVACDENSDEKTEQEAFGCRKCKDKPRFMMFFDEENQKEEVACEEKDLTPGALVCDHSEAECTKDGDKEETASSNLFSVFCDEKDEQNLLACKECQ